MCTLSTIQQLQGAHVLAHCPCCAGACLLLFVLQVASMDSQSVFYWALAPMVAFYAFFAAVLLPNADKIQPVALAAKYCATLVSPHTHRRQGLSPVSACQHLTHGSL